MAKVIVRRLPAQLSEAEFWAKMCEDAGQPVSFSLLYYVAERSAAAGPTRVSGYLSFGSSEVGPMREATIACRIVTHAFSLRAQAAAAFLDVFRRSPPLFGTGAPARRARRARHLWSRDRGGRYVIGPGSASETPLAELALCQKMFRPKPRRDSRQGTIERDADFKAFVKGLDATPAPVPPDVLFDAKEDVPKTAALVEYLRSRKKARKERTLGADPRSRKTRDQPAKPTAKEGRGSKKPALSRRSGRTELREPGEARQQRPPRATGSDKACDALGRCASARKLPPSCAVLERLPLDLPDRRRGLDVRARRRVSCQRDARIRARVRVDLPFLLPHKARHLRWTWPCVRAPAYLAWEAPRKSNLRVQYSATCEPPVVLVAARRCLRPRLRLRAPLSGSSSELSLSVALSSSSSALRLARALLCCRCSRRRSWRPTVSISLANVR